MYRHLISVVGKYKQVRGIHIYLFDKFCVTINAAKTARQIEGANIINMAFANAPVAIAA